MSLKTILAPLCGTEQDRLALRNALGVAAALGAHVTALLPDGPLSAILAEEPVPPRRWEDSLVREGRAMLARRREATRVLFDEVVRETGARVAEEPGGGAGATIRFEAKHGDDPEVIREAAVLHDLVLFHRAVEGPEAGQATPEIRNALQASGRPLLVVPTRMPAKLADRVAIAWNSSLEGAHAVSAALPLLGQAGSVHVLTAATSKTRAEEGKRLRRYLGWHGIAATGRTVETGGGSVGAALLAAAGEVGADLLVTGGQTRSRIREAVLGGVTQHVLRHAALPVLLSR